MLRIKPQSNAQAVRSYYKTADYYSEGQEIVGLWGGKGAARLGLSGSVDQFAFERLCDNLHPMTGDPLTVRTRSERRVGYDFTFSVPKSVSLLYALSGDQDILEAFRVSVDETMREIEAEMKCRVRMGGRDEDRVTSEMTWAEFIHTTSRPVDGLPDPQLHAHVFVFNATFDNQEQRWKAGQFGDIKRDGDYFQAAFRVRLANRLQDIGFEVQRKRDDFEIAGVPADVLKRFSRRTTQIEKLAEKLGITDAKRKDGLGAATRERKGKPLSLASLRKEWNKGLSDKEREQLAAVHAREHAFTRAEHGEAMAVDHATQHCFVREAVVPERKLVTEALKRGLGSVTVEDVTREMGERPLIRNEVDGREMATTREMLALEAKMTEFARRGRGRFRPLADPNRPCSRDWFNDGQKAAVRHVLGSRDSVTIIRGAAGTGKTTLEQEIGEALKEAKKPVVALAQTAKASREVLRQEAGFAMADTVARFFKDQYMQEAARGGVILVDEASMLGTRDMARLFEISESVGARVLLVGDRRQHRAVSAGEPLRLLEENAGLPVAEVTEILRQQGDYKKAAKCLSEGNVEEAFTELDKLGWIREVADSERDQQLAADYLAAVSEKKRNGEHKSALVVSPTWAEAAHITEAIREGLKAEGKLGKERSVNVWIASHLTDAQKADPTEYDAGFMVQFHEHAKGHKKGSRLVVGDGVVPPTELADRFEVYRPGGLALAVGDRIRITAGGKTKNGEHRLNNGSLFTVEGFNRRGDIIVNGGWVIDRDFGHLAQGYVVSSHASEGATVDKVLVGMSSESFPATNQRSAYVAWTRGREQVLVYTDDRKELLKAICRPDEPLTATELAESMNGKPPSRNGHALTPAHQQAALLARNRTHHMNNGSVSRTHRELDHDR
jgi:conjugative relaxase-like TrwC/TraI family protein